jgi:peptidyl-prolyl cis-trans isomerase D
MSITASIRKRPWLLLGMIFIALLAFLVNPDSMDKMFGKNPNILGKVNGEEITRDEFNDQLGLLQQQSQGQQQQGLEEQAWQTLVQSKLIKQQFEKMGLKLTDEIFWNQLQFDPMFSIQSAPQNYDEKGNFKVAQIKKQIEDLKQGDVNQYNEWLKVKKSIEYRMMARQLFANVTTGVTANKKEAAELIKQRDQLANIDFVKVDYAAFGAKNPVKVTTKDLADYIQKHPVMFKSPASRNLGIVFFPASPSSKDDALVLKEVNQLNEVGVDNGSGLESFKNTKNDSMFVTINSDIPYNPNYFTKSQIPEGLKDKVTTASVGQIVGPIKEQGYYIVAKLLDKRNMPSDSVKSSHILFAYKGAERSTSNRTKEEAKALADKTLAEIKANPAKFNEDLKLSDEPGAEKEEEV